MKLVSRSTTLLPSPNKQLGDFLRSRRAKLAPKNRPASGRRRTPGLKREEVALAAGISVEWYVKLEQGRGSRPSVETIAALSRALELDAVEARHLAKLAASGPERPFVARPAPASLVALVEQMVEPCYLTNQRWDVLAWNAPAADLLVDFAMLTPQNRNILAFMLLDPRARRLFAHGWQSEGARMVSRFRADFDRWSGDPAFEMLVADFRAGCPEFEIWWQRYDLDAATSGTKELTHPRLGIVRYNHASFQANDDPALKLAIYTRTNGPDSR
ncbi:helix-turn-helix transcriptional regulator [Bradyrhizobium elkanii]|uniref:helix-turn-helix transcriptional regulator n=1 Tax=Bradyrhizobium elkanii TaxID=29448 RepID=UPI0006862DE7|nr:helix-turn-helix transcriptional regulator [Bradyrhizobium elkanii]WLA83257.1 helix-turn-helix transcriptional regulator [Bradyrhizobium elkanii]